jgi:hypothetical protein
LGEKIVWEIASNIIFGNGKPSTTDVVPVDGYSPVVIAEAITLVGHISLPQKGYLTFGLDPAWH